MDNLGRPWDCLHTQYFVADVFLTIVYLQCVSAASLSQQEPLSEAAAVLLRHLGLCSL